MEDEEREFAEAFVLTQGLALACRDILREVLIHAVRSQPDPRAFIATMFEAISVRMDRAPDEASAKRAAGWQRQFVAWMFRDVERALRVAPDPAPPPG